MFAYTITSVKLDLQYSNSEWIKSACRSVRQLRRVRASARLPHTQLIHLRRVARFLWVILTRATSIVSLSLVAFASEDSRPRSVIYFFDLTCCSARSRPKSLFIVPGTWVLTLETREVPEYLISRILKTSFYLSCVYAFRRSDAAGAMIYCRSARDTARKTKYRT